MPNESAFKSTFRSPFRSTFGSAFFKSAQNKSSQKIINKEENLINSDEIIDNSFNSSI